MKKALCGIGWTLLVLAAFTLAFFWPRIRRDIETVVDAIFAIADMEG
jgi:hypothetical protein